jgi:protein phosphatase PTC7
MRAQAAMFGGVYFEDWPRDAAMSNITMQHGDVLVLATDGVFDNLNNQDILKIVAGRMVIANAWTGTPTGTIGVSSRLDELTRPGGLESSPSPPSSPSSSTSSVSAPSSAQSHSTLQGFLAASIAGEAKLASIDVRRDGPFAKEAQRYHPGEWFRGGKIDDICVIVVIAVEGE